MDKIFENFTVTILKLNKLVQKIKNYEMQKYGLKTIHVMCGYYLNCYSEGLTASELVKLTLEDKAAISRALRTLHTKGFISYEPDKCHSVIRLTEEGKKFATDVCRKAAKAVEAGSYDFSESERRSFYKALGTIAENLTTYYGNLIKNEKAVQL